VDSTKNPLRKSKLLLRLVGMAFFVLLCMSTTKTSYASGCGTDFTPVYNNTWPGRVLYGYAYRSDADNASVSLRFSRYNSDFSEYQYQYFDAGSDENSKFETVQHASWGYPGTYYLRVQAFWVENSVAVWSINTYDLTVTNPPNDFVGCLEFYLEEPATGSVGWWDYSSQTVTDTPVFNPSGGENPYYYNFDGLQCTRGIINAEYHDYAPGTDPPVYTQYWQTTVFPQDSENDIFNGVVTIPNPPFNPNNNFEANITSTCWDVDGDAVWQHQDDYNTYLPPELPVYDIDPCIDLSLTDLDGVLNCGGYKVKTFLKYLFMPTSVSASTFTNLFDTLKTRFPFNVGYEVGDLLTTYFNVFNSNEVTYPDWQLSALGQNYHITFDIVDGFIDTLRAIFSFFAGMACLYVIYRLVFNKTGEVHDS